MNRVFKIIGNSALVILLLTVISIPAVTSSFIKLEEENPVVLPSSTVREPVVQDSSEYVEPAFYGKSREELYEIFLKELEETKQTTETDLQEYETYPTYEEELP